LAVLCEILPVSEIAVLASTWFHPDVTQVTDQELEQALATTARVIERYGDAYWPLFDRLERELEARRTRRARLRAQLSNNVRRAGAKISPPETDARL